MVLRGNIIMNIFIMSLIIIIITLLSGFHSFCYANEIDMGFTPFYKSDMHIYLSYARLKAFGLSKIQKKNRALLKGVMIKAGFIPLSYEWWHFDGIEKNAARKKYQIIE